MAQNYKSVYFSDIRGDNSAEKSLTLAFGELQSATFETVKNLSSHEIRGLLGFQSFKMLERKATEGQMSVNQFCLSLLEQKIQSLDQYKSQMTLPGFETATSLIIDPIQVTFRGGKEEPLHNWYPYLEGYSPEFVREILRKYSPNATSVYDPFGGAGTTQITSGIQGIQTYYSEINPLMQYVTSIKLKTYGLDPNSKAEVLYKLPLLIENWPACLKNIVPDEYLAKTYKETFNESKFFDDNTFRLILKTRTYIDQLAIREQYLSDLLTIAVIASLIASSNLLRRGDVRFRKGKEIQGKEDFEQKVQNQLKMMLSDIQNLGEPFVYAPVLITEDARKISDVPQFKIDTVITSPPYLNGTNYFRNTKVELWFIKGLRSSADLSAFRAKAVTAGINDVTMNNNQNEIPKPIEPIFLKLKENAYDKRIPLMVLGYFQDMIEVFSGLRKHLIDGAKIAIDLGDSIYGNIHVQTDQLLVEVLEQLGYILEADITLRKRLSRNRTELRQALLIFSFKRDMNVRIKANSSFWQANWESFKNSLPHQKPPYSKRNWGNSLHSLCSYQGKMKPALAYHLVKTFVPKGGVMLDPFAGVGTIPFEAALLGSKSFGFEISPTAFSISKAKIGDIQELEANNLIASLDDFISSNEVAQDEIDRANSVKFNGQIEEYFHPNTLREILLARRFFIDKPPQSASEHLVFASLLHILHGNRPYALSRQSHPITPYKPTGEFKYRALIPHLKDKVARSFKAERPSTIVHGEMFFQDATGWWPQEVKDLDAVITSPPFFDSTRFYLGNWMRLWFSGWEKQDFDEKPSNFIDERQKRSFSVYEPLMRQSRERLKPGGVVVFHLGLSYKSDMAEELAKIAKTWFEVVDIYTEDVSHVESHGIRDKGTVTGHQFLILI